MTACPSGRQWNGLCSTCGQSWAIMFRMQACQITVIKFFSVFLFFLFFFFFNGHLHTLKTDKKLGRLQTRQTANAIWDLSPYFFFCNAPWLRHLHKRKMNVRYFMHSRSTLCKHVQYLNIQHTIKFSSLSAPTKIEELTAGSDEKTHVAQWLERATRIRKTLGSIPGGAALCFFVWSGCQFFYLCRCWKRREFDRNDPDKSEFTIDSTHSCESCDLSFFSCFLFFWSF